MTIALSVRVQDYAGERTLYFGHVTRLSFHPILFLYACTDQQFSAGFPEGSPITTSYFSNPIHCRDQYSISFSFIPKKNINGDDLVFGNDFDRPVRDRLPPGFNLAFKLAKWIMDPGLDGKLLVDKPYLYGPALSSLNIFRVGEKKLEKASGSKGWKLPATLHKDVVQEGADGSGKEVRREYNVPEQADKRRKWFLNKPNREKFQFEEGRLYEADFFNPYICFSGKFTYPLDLFLSFGYHSVEI